MVFLLIFFYLLGDFHLIFMAEFRELDFSWTQIGVQRAFFLLLGCYRVFFPYSLTSIIFAAYFEFRKGGIGLWLG